jgi:hypothetical protein
MKSSFAALFVAALLALPLALAAAVRIDVKPMFPDPIDPSGLLTVTGSGFTSDDMKLPIVTKDQLMESGIDPAGQSSLVTGTTQTGARDHSFCSELQITVVEQQAGVTLGPGDHRFRVVNRDAQFAETSFRFLK